MVYYDIILSQIYCRGDTADMSYTEELKLQIITRYKNDENIIGISKESGISRSTMD